MKIRMTRKRFLSVSAKAAAVIDGKKISAYAKPVGQPERYPAVVIGAGFVVRPAWPGRVSRNFGGAHRETPIR